MRRIFLYTLLVFPVVFILSCKPQPQKEVKRNIILDVDVSVDDMMTILYFLACPDIDIKAITIESGVSCVDSGAAIVHRLLKMTGRTEIPVASGTGIPIAGNNSFPKEWQPPVDSPFGLELPEYAPEASAPDAVSLIAQLAGTYKDNITILALGPMTNIARAFINNSALAENIDQIYVSDGAVNVQGGIHIEYPNILNSVSGWNLWVDAKAAGIVFNSGAQVVLVPLDLTSLHGQDPLALKADFVDVYKQHVRGTLGKSMAVLMENWLNSYVHDQQEGNTVKMAPIWDVVAGMIYHHPEIGTVWQDSHVKIMEDVPESAGQIVVTGSENPNVKICLKGNQVLLDSLLLKTAGM